MTGAAAAAQAVPARGQPDTASAATVQVELPSGPAGGSHRRRQQQGIIADQHGSGRADGTDAEQSGKLNLRHERLTAGAWVIPSDVKAREASAKDSDARLEGERSWSIPAAMQPAGQVDLTVGDRPSTAAALSSSVTLSRWGFVRQVGVDEPAALTYGPVRYVYVSSICVSTPLRSAALARPRREAKRNPIQSTHCLQGSRGKIRRSAPQLYAGRLAGPEPTGDRPALRHDKASRAGAVPPQPPGTKQLWAQPAGELRPYWQVVKPGAGKAKGPSRGRPPPKQPGSAPGIRAHPLAQGFRPTTA